MTILLLLLMMMMTMTAFECSHSEAQGKGTTKEKEVEKLDRLLSLLSKSPHAPEESAKPPQTAPMSA